MGEAEKMLLSQITCTCRSWSLGQGGRWNTWTHLSSLDSFFKKRLLLSKWIFYASSPFSPIFSKTLEWSERVSNSKLLPSYFSWMWLFCAILGSQTFKTTVNTNILLGWNYTSMRSEDPTWIRYTREDVYMSIPCQHFQTIFRVLVNLSFPGTMACNLQFYS